MPIPEPKYPNSAGRLLAVLTLVDPRTTVAANLAPLLLNETINDPNDIKEVSRQGIRAVSELHLLYSQFLQDMAEVDIGDEQRSVLLNGLGSLGERIYPLQVNVNSGAISPAEKSLLEVCATVLPKEGTPDPSDIESIRESILELQQLVESSDLPNELRIVILECLRLSQDSITRFNIHGVRGLHAAFKGMLAEVAALHFSISDEEKQRIQKTEAWEVLTRHLKNFDAVASKLLKYKPLLEGISSLFLGKE